MATLLISPQRIKDTTRIENNVSDKLLKDIILNVQETQLQPIIGTSMYNKLTTGDPNTDLNADEKSLISEYIWPVLRYATLAQLVETGSYKFTSSGVVKSGSSDFKVLEGSDLAKVKREINYDLQHFIQYLVDFIEHNASKFPEYDSNIDVGDYPHAPISAGSIYISRESLTKKNHTSTF